MEARLVKQLQSTIQDLDDVWREIGFSQRERAEQTELLFAEVTGMFKAKIEQEKVLLETYQDSVEEIKAKILLCADRLDLPPPSSQASDQQQEESLVLCLSRLKHDHAVLDGKRVEMEQKIAAKLDQLCQYGQEMKEPVLISLETLKLTQENLDKVSHQCSLAKHELEKRKEILAAGREQVFDLLECLQQYDAKSPVDDCVANHREMDLGRDTLLALQARAEELVQIKQRQSELFLTLFAEIRPLWDKLGVTQLEQDAFFARQGNSLGDKAMQACRNEIVRLKQVFKSKMAEFIAQLRVEIESKSEELGPLPLATAQRLEGLMREPVRPEDFERCEQLLALHEHELSELDRELDQLKPIQHGVNKYLHLCEERKQYELLVQDSSRLLSRNKRNSGLPSLQEEEKMRQRVSQIPKFVSQLKQLISEVEQTRNQTLKIGCRLLDPTGCSSGTADALDRSEQEHDERVANERLNRKQQQQQNGISSKTDPAANSRRTTGPPLRPRN
ncbi:hypothetical protein BASA81_005843 [Batrachochytrium salamandrivorans]|nr:hypothetical protein BASA81_005843 [Batrachochytrium salamandrivorans]